MFLTVNTFENIGRFILVLIIFIFVLGITYFSTRFIAKYGQNKIINGNIKVHETFQIAQNKYIQLISVGSKYYAIAVSKDNITLLGELNGDDIDLTNLGNNKMMSFKEIMELAKNSFDKKNGKKIDENNDEEQ